MLAGPLVRSSYRAGRLYQQAVEARQGAFGVDLAALQTSFDAFLESRFKGPKAALAPVEIELGTHDLFSAALNGPGSLAIDKVKGLKFDLSVQGSGTTDIASVAVDQLALNLGGNASARLAGKAKNFTAVLRGLSTLDASALDSSDAVLGAEGPATVRATRSRG